MKVKEDNIPKGFPIFFGFFSWGFCCFVLFFFVTREVVVVPANNPVWGQRQFVESVYFFFSLLIFLIKIEFFCLWKPPLARWWPPFWRPFFFWPNLFNERLTGTLLRCHGNVFFRPPPPFFYATAVNGMKKMKKKQLFQENKAILIVKHVATFFLYRVFTGFDLIRYERVIFLLMVTGRNRFDCFYEGFTGF